MGRRGPQRIPTAILRKRGSWRAQERGDDVVFPAGVPDPPPSLKGAALEEWARVSVLLGNAGVLTPQDRAALALYCQAWSDWLAAQADIEANGVEVVGADGTRYTSPAFMRAAKSYEQIMKTAATLGLTPAARAGLKTSASKEGTVASRFFKKLG